MAGHGRTRRSRVADPATRVWGGGAQRGRGGHVRTAEHPIALQIWRSGGEFKMNPINLSRALGYAN